MRSINDLCSSIGLDIVGGNLVRLDRFVGGRTVLALALRSRRFFDRLCRAVATNKLSVAARGLDLLALPDHLGVRILLR